MEVGVPGLNGVGVVLLGRLRERETATLRSLFMGLLVREKTTKKRSVVRLNYFIDRIKI